MTLDQHKFEKSSLSSLEEKSSSLPTTLAIGSVVERKYELIEILGRGAHGVVYKARHKMLDQFVAIKFYDPQIFGSEHSTERFQKEASLLSTLTHPNIVKFQTFGKLNESQAYMVLEFLQGETLEFILSKNGPLDETRILSLFIQVCRGLKYVHEQEVLHRDLKPSNIMVQSDAEGEHLHVKLMDFGVFKDLNTTGKQQLTQTGTLVGSANYMSPEQCKSEALSQSSDIYSIGCVMYEAFVGSAPMHAESELLIMSNQLSKEISEVRARRGISKQTEDIVLRCLNKIPENRFASAGELELALEQAMLSTQVGRRRRPLALSSMHFLAITPLAILAAFFLYTWLSPFYSPQKPTPEVLAHVNQKQRLTVLPEIEPDLLQSYQNMLDWLDATSGKYYRHMAEQQNQRLHKNYLRADETLNDPNDPKLVADVLLRADILRERLGISTPDKILGSAEKYVLSKLHFRSEDIRSDNPVQKLLQRYCAPHFLAKGNLKMLDQVFASIKGNGDETNTKENTAIVQLIVGIEERRLRLAETYLLMSDVERWRGNFVEARDYAQKAFEVPHIPDHLLAISLVKIGIASQLCGDDDKAKNFLHSAAASKSWQKGTRNLGVANDMLRALNDLGMSQDVIDFAYKPYSDAKFSWQEALVQKEIARAYEAQGKLPEAKRVLQRALKECKDEIPSHECSDLLEQTFLRLLHAQHDDGAMQSDAHSYLEALKSTDLTRYMRATGKILSLIEELGTDTRANWQQVDQELAALEKDRKAPAECVELRLAEASAARRRKDWVAELDFLGKASQQIPEKTSLRMNCLRLVVNARVMESLSMAAKPDYIRIEETHDLSHNHYQEAAAPFAFFNKDIFLRAIFSAPIPHSSLDKRRAMVELKGKEAGVGAVDDYADCAIHLANDLARKNQKEESFSLLTTCLSIIQRYRPTRFDDMLAVCLCGRELAPTPALREPCEKAAEKDRAKMQLQDPDEMGWEPYRSWTR